MSASSQPRSPSLWRAAPYLVVVFLVALGASAPAPSAQPCEGSQPSQGCAAEVRWEAGATVVRAIGLSGAPEQMGYQHGRRLQAEIRAAIGDSWRQCSAGRADGWRTCRERAAALGEALPPALLAEARGLALGAQVDESDI